MSTALATSNSEAFYDVVVSQLALLEQAQLPESILRQAAHIGNLTLKSVNASAGIEGSKNFKQETIADNDDSPPSETIINDLLDSGKISEIEAEALSKIAPLAVKLLGEHTPSEDKDDSKTDYIPTKFFDELLEFQFNKIYDAKTERKERRKRSSQYKLNNFFVLSEVIAKRNDEPIIDYDSLLRAFSPTADLAHGIINREDGKPLVDLKNFVYDKNTDLLKSLLLVDLQIYVSSLPKPLIDKFAKSDKEGLEDIPTDESIFGNLVDEITDFKEFKLLVDDMFQPFVKGVYKKRLSKELEAKRMVGTRIGLSWRAIESFEISQKIIVNEVELRRSKGSEHNRNILYDSFQETIDKGKELLDATKEYFMEHPSVERMIGALSVENWLDFISSNYISRDDTDSISRPGLLHAAINTEQLNNDLALLEQVAGPLSTELERVNKKWLINGTMLRELKGGLKLRQSLEDWLEPGSNKPLFSRDSAQQLAGLALKLENNPVMTLEFLNDLRQAHLAWAGLDYLHSPNLKRGTLLSAMDTLAELYDSGNKLLWKEDGYNSLFELARQFSEPLPEHLPDEAPQITIEQLKDIQFDETIVSPAWKRAAEFNHIEFIQAFPAGTTIQVIYEDFARLSKGYEGNSVEWERIDSLLELRENLELAGLKVSLLRLMQSSWHPLPHYVLEVEGPNNKVAVIESPIYSNATYIIPNNDWRDIVQFSKEEARDDFNAIPKVHAAPANMSNHREKLLNTIFANL